MTKPDEFHPYTFEQPKFVWTWDMFGSGQLVVSTQEVPWIRRVMTKLLFGSKWRKPK